MRFLTILLVILTLAATAVASKVIVLPYKGAIGPVAQLQLQRAIEQAKEELAEAVVIELDTPGGLLSTTRAMVKDILNSPVPIIVFVAPSGAHAGSAGVFLTMSAHVAAMAPGTNIGAAHPVNLGGGKADSIAGPMGDKVLNDAVAQIKTIAAQRERNVEWAERAVRQSVSITETEAESLNVINTIAYNTVELLRKIDGKSVKMTNGAVRIITTHNTKIIHHEPGVTDELLNFLADPNVAYIFFALGFYGLLFELQNPGAIWPGVIGGLSLIFAFMSFQVLPVNLAGVMLIIIAFVLFILEVKIISKGAFTVGGIVALITGSLLLFDLPDDMPGINWAVIAGVVVSTVLFFVFV
ncbi:MAG: nodulation protein NfeD, partial [bacterium]|nr:nodulation protein NfeD [bacterium]